MLSGLVDVGRSGVSVRRVGGCRAGEIRITRFLRNPRVSPSEMVAHALARTARLAVGRHVLAIQDTTTLRDDGGRVSLNQHVMIAVDAEDGAVLGLVDAVCLSRSGGKKATRSKRPFAAKESRRWLDAAGRAAALAAAGAGGVTVVADQEADIYDAFACRPQGTDLVIRAHHDRVLADGSRLSDCLAEAAELGRQRIALAAHAGRPARQAELALKAREIVVKRPQRKYPGEAASLPETVRLTLVEAREIDPPAGVPAAHWRLLTSHEAKSLAQAMLITGFYRQRWAIEQLFRILKTQGFDIEAVRVAEDGPFENLATATLIAAIRVLQMVHERDGAAQRPLQDAFEPEDQPAIETISQGLEGKTARQKNPHPTGSLAYVSWVCARLGGWTGYYGKPGPIVILRGLQELTAMLRAWRLLINV